MWHNLVRSFHLGFLPYVYLFDLLSRPSSAYLFLSHVSPTFRLIIIPSSHLYIFVTSWRLPMVTLELRKRVDPVFLKIFKQFYTEDVTCPTFFFSHLCVHYYYIKYNLTMIIDNFVMFSTKGRFYPLSYTRDKDK